MIDFQIKIENGEIHRHAEINSNSKDTLTLLLLLEEMTQEIKEGIKNNLVKEVDVDE